MGTQSQASWLMFGIPSTQETGAEGLQLVNASLGYKVSFRLRPCQKQNHEIRYLEHHLGNLAVV